MASSLIPVLGVTAPATGTPPAPVTDGEHRPLLHAMAAVPDPRDPRGVRYPLAGLLAVAVCAVLAGASSFAAISDWLHDLDEQPRARLGFDRGVPDHGVAAADPHGRRPAHDGPGPPGYGRAPGRTRPDPRGTAR